MDAIGEMARALGVPINSPQDREMFRQQLRQVLDQDDMGGAQMSPMGGQPMGGMGGGMPSNGNALAGGMQQPTAMPMMRGMGR